MEQADFTGVLKVSEKDNAADSFQRPSAERVRDQLERLYQTMNRRERVHPDPLETLYPFPSVRDREVVGLIAAGLAFGGVRQILRSIHTALGPMDGQPRAFIEHTSERELRRPFRSFVHRWVDGRAFSDFLTMLRTVLREHGTIEACFMAGHRPAAETVMHALTSFVRTLRGARSPNPLLPDPAAGSACKRLHLYVRWMVRKDAVDPGGWSGISPKQLLIPLDVHMHRLSRAMGLTRRKSADARTVTEVTNGFRAIRPDDPVRYDFSLTRLGIQKSPDRMEWLGFFKCL